MSRRRCLQCLAATVLTACILGQPAVLTAQPGNAVPGSFICLVDDSEDAFAIGQAAVQATGGTLGHVYTHALNGFSIQVPPGIIVANLRARAGIIHAEPDMIMHTCATVIPTGVDRIDAEGVLPSGLDCSTSGIAIIDTGIQRDHPDLNVLGGRRFYTRGPRTYEDGLYDDDNGHGTHVAGIAAARGVGVVGVAPGARLYAVKVLGANGSGYLSDIIAGVNWVAGNAASLGIHVANMSLSGQGRSPALYAAMANCPVLFAVAAGNNSANVYGPDGQFDTLDDHIPAAYGGQLSRVYTISAMVDTDGEPGGVGAATGYGKDDSFASFSNYSRENAIAYLLPGVSIYSTYLNSGYATMSGTSMASPHAAGLLALCVAANSTSVLISVPQNDVSGRGLTVLNDPDSWWEPLGYSIFPAGTTIDDPPTVSISSPADGATFDSGAVISFSGAASDTEDGSLTASLVWTSSLDGWIGNGGSFSATLLNPGTHTITASVTDSGGNTASDSITVTVTPRSSGITLTARGYKVKGVQKADLTWSGAMGDSVDVYRNGTKLPPTANDGFYTDNINKKGGGSYTYQIHDGTTWSNTATVTF